MLFNTAKTLPIIKQIDLIEKKEFAVATLNSKNENFIIHVTFFNLELEIYLFYKTQLAFFITDKASIIIFSKYTNFTNIFSM